jgi:hypothetical protein
MDDGMADKDDVFRCLSRASLRFPLDALERNLRGDDVRAFRLMDNAADAEGKSELDLGLMAFLRLSYSSFKDWSYDAPPISGNSRAVSM